MCRYRISHGETLPIESKEAPSTVGTAFQEVAAPNQIELVEADAAHWLYGYLFKDLQESSTDLLPTHDQAVNNLRVLADTMRDSGNGPGTPTPTIYTFFGQFVDHDITLAKVSPSISDISTGTPIPLSLEQIQEVELEKLVYNLRSPNLELTACIVPCARDPINPLNY